MGSGGSKLDQDHETPIPGKLRPLLRRRLEEIKRKRRNRSKACALKNSTTQSKKVLLKDNDIDFDGSERKSVSSDEGNALKVAPEPECDNNESEIITSKVQIKIVKAVEVKPVLLVCPTFATMLRDVEEVRVVSSPAIVLIREKGTKKEQSNEEKEEEKCIEKKVVVLMEAMAVTVAKVKAPETFTEAEEENPEEKQTEREREHEEVEQNEEQEQKEEETEQEGEQEEEDQEENGVEERLICPGSPSFREYCNLSSNNDRETKDKEDDVLERISGSGESIGASIVVSETELCLVESVNKKKKRVKRGRRLKVVRLPKAKSMPSAMKNLLMVNACHNPACGAGHDKVRLLKGSV